MEENQVQYCQLLLSFIFFQLLISVNMRSDEKVFFKLKLLMFKLFLLFTARVVKLFWLTNINFRKEDLIILMKYSVFKSFVVISCDRYPQ